MKNLLRRLKIGLYTFFASLKKTEETILTPITNDNGENGVHKEVHNQRVSQHLLKGEITQEVVDLRYRDYTVASAAKNLRYTPDGRVVKIKNDSNSTKFTVINKDIRLSILDSISFEKDRKFEHTHTLQMKYNVIPRFKLEKSCITMDVNIDAKTVILHFIKHFNVYNQDKPFINELKKICDNNLPLARHEFNELEEIKFISFKINGVDDYIQYIFKKLNAINIEEKDTEYVLTYNFDSYEMENLIDKFYSEEMAAKYENHEKKHVQMDNTLEEKEYEMCEICGKPIIEYVEEDFRNIYTTQNICHLCLYNLIIESEKK